jgi:hypothetical protein
MQFSKKSGATSNLLLQQLQEAELLKLELMTRKALSDPWYWLTECTKTVDEQDPENPYKPFPKDEYIRLYLEVLKYEPVLFCEKSRTMMASWTTAAHCAHLMFTRAAVGVVFQSRDEDRAVHDVEYVKALWKNSLDPLRERWKLSRDLESQPYNYFSLANGSWCLGITGDPQKIRSEHPTVVVLDEAAHIETEANYNIAQATRCKQIVCLSSAWPGWFREFTEFANPVDWPDYSDRKPVFG